MAVESDELQQYYAELACDGGFEARCHMELPERSLVGARIVNVGCRRGKGTYKLSEQVGEGGFVVGVDWNEAFVEAARAGVPRALERSGLSRCNMAFRVGFPEDLAAAGLEEGWADFVYLNSSLSLFASPARALRECGRVLAPGGVLLAEVPVAEPNGKGRAGDADFAVDASRGGPRPSERRAGGADFRGTSRVACDGGVLRARDSQRAAAFPRGGQRARPPCPHRARRRRDLSPSVTRRRSMSRRTCPFLHEIAVYERLNAETEDAISVKHVSKGEVSPLRRS